VLLGLLVLLALLGLLVLLALLALLVLPVQSDLLLLQEPHLALIYIGGLPVETHTNG
jgi:hypothetical protein